MFQEFIEILILSAVQGVSEFLPISSSAHLILVSKIYDFKTSSLLIDISLHLGSLFAIIFYFRKDLFDLRHNKKLLNLIIIGSVPLIIFGYILYFTEVIYLLRNLKVIGISTRLAVRDIKKKYLKLIPYAWELIESRINNNLIFADLKNYLDANFSKKIRMKK